jgi:hypothetical protein
MINRPQQKIQTLQSKKGFLSDSGLVMVKAKPMLDPDPPWLDSISHLSEPNLNIKKPLGVSNNDPQFKIQNEPIQTRAHPIQTLAQCIMEHHGLGWSHFSQQPMSIHSNEPRQHRYTRAQSPSPYNYYGSRSHPQTGAKYSHQHHGRDLTGLPDRQEVIRGD